MKTIFILLIIAGGLYAILESADYIDQLMGSADAAQVTSSSGVKSSLFQGGSGFNVNNLAVPGQVTVVDFYVSWCSACKRLTRDYQRFIKVRPDVAIRRVKMKDKWNESWAEKQYGLDIGTTPHVLIFDEQGKLLIQDEGRNKLALKLLYKWMDAELRKG